MEILLKLKKKLFNNMPASRSAGMILFKNTSEVRKYLILRASRNVHEERLEFWDISKGELDKGESGFEAARREVDEETGIKNFNLISDFKFTAQYFTKRDGKTIPKFVAVFLAEVSADHEVKLSSEHDAFAWATLEEALKKLSTMKKALHAADEFLSGH